MVTSNHVHLLVKDTEQGVIARSVQLVASQTAQEYNRRKARQGAFWEDRYHAAAIATDAHHFLADYFRNHKGIAWSDPKIADQNSGLRVDDYRFAR